MNEFYQRYKMLSNTDLLRVLENHDEYQPEAVKAAKAEISERGLSEQELEFAQSELEVERQTKRKKFEKKEAVEKRIKGIGASFFDIINPIQKEAPTPERIILSIVLVFGFIAIYSWYNYFGFVRSMLEEDVETWDAGTLECVLPFISLPIIVLLFWGRYKVGWILLFAYMVNATISGLVLTILKWEMEYEYASDIDVIFSPPSAVDEMLKTLFFWSNAMGFS